MEEKDEKKYNLIDQAVTLPSLSLDLYALVGRGTVLLGGDHEVLSTGARIQMKQVLGRGSYGTVIGGEYNYDDDHQVRTIAVKRLLSADPKDVLNKALRECGAMLDGKRGSLDSGVVPCYGVVVGSNITEKLLTSVLKRLTMDEVHFAGNVPVVVGRWSDNRSHGWNVALLVPWLEDAIDGDDLSFGLFPPGIFVSKSSGASQTVMNSALKENDQWQHVPAAIVACVTRAAKFLLENGLWSRNLVASDLLFPPGFAAAPFDPKNCLLNGFGSVISLEYTPCRPRPVCSRYSWDGSVPYMHPLTVQFRHSTSSLRHVTDVFNLAVDALQMITGGTGHPLFRCSRWKDHEAIELRILSKYDSSNVLLEDVAKRIATLNEEDLRGIATMSSYPCKEIASRISVSPPDQSRIADIQRDFRVRSDLFGWTSQEHSALGPTPELAQLARLFQLTGPELSETKPNIFIGVYDDILKQLVPTKHNAGIGTVGPAVPTDRS